MAEFSSVKNNNNSNNILAHRKLTCQEELKCYFAVCRELLQRKEHSVIETAHAKSDLTTET